MSRVHNAIEANRCVLIVGTRLLGDASVRAALTARPGVPAYSLGEAVDGFPAMTPESLAAAQVQGGVVVLVEPEPAADGRGLVTLGRCLSSSSNRPRLVVVSRAFNPFALPAELRSLKLDQERTRGRAFIDALPEASVEAAAPADTAAPARRSSGGSPALAFVGREDELTAFHAALDGAKGAILVLGAEGVGKRWLVEQALSSSERTRHPDLTLGWGVAADTLYARLAVIAKQAGDARLFDAMAKAAKRPKPDALARLAVEVLQNEALAEQVVVIEALDPLVRPDGSFVEDGRLELLLRALLSNPLSLRVVFLTSRVPCFFDPEVDAVKTVVAVEGLKGRELHALFESYRFEDYPRDKMQAVHKRTGGHPLATRLWAIALRDADDISAVEKKKKTLAVADGQKLGAVISYLQQQVDALSPESRAALARIAHFPVPATGQELNEVLGVPRKIRLELTAKGLLDLVPGQEAPRYRVHHLVRNRLTRREVQDIETSGQIGRHIAERWRSASDEVSKLAYGQWLNRCAILARSLRNRQRLDLPDNDALLETIRGLLRAKKPHPSLAESRINEVLNADKGNAEAWLLKAELASRTNRGAAALNSVFENAIQAAPTPELFHQRANLVRGSRGGGRLDSAAEVIRSACSLFPLDGRLKRRFAGILIGQGSYTEAHDVLRRALDLEPTMSDTYGMLCDTLTAQGAAKWPEATQYIEEALRLAPENPAHWVRQARLERLHGAIDPDSRAQRWDRAQQLLDDALKREARNIAGLLEMSTLLLDRQDDELLGRVSFLLEQMGDRSGGTRRQIQQARLHARKGESEPAQTILGRLLERNPTNYAARAALGELYLQQGRVFEALSATMEAQAAAPPHAPERVVYEQVIARLRHLIDSGQALEMAKAAELPQQAADTPSSDAVPVTSEMPQSGPVRGDAVGVRLAGRTTRRRKRKSSEAETVED